MNYANITYDLLPHNMAPITLTIKSNCKWRHCHLMYGTVTYSDFTSCHGYMWNKIISKLFQPLSTSVWKNFISAHGNLP